jgi:hypothetical protein
MLKYILRNEDDGSGGGGAAVVDPPAPPAPPPAPDAKAPPAAKAGDPPAKAGDPPAGDKGAKTDDKNYWPDNWRDTVSKGDAKRLEKMGRYASPEAVVDALIEAQTRISKGELKPVLGKNATPEQLKEWREANGIPETHDKYDLGDVKPDNVRPEHLDVILQHAHKSNQTPEQVKETVGAIKDVLQTMQTERAEMDADQQTKGTDALREEWGGEFRKNINVIHGLLDGSADKALKDKVLNGRLADGTLIGNSPEAMRMLLGLALIQNPTGVVVPGGGGAQEEGIKAELDKINKVMTTNRKAYDKDQKMQERFRDLTNAAIKMGAMDENGNWKK